jgi:hypothetical protein
MQPRAAAIDRDAERLSLREGAPPDAVASLEHTHGEPGVAQLACRDDPPNAYDTRIRIGIAFAALPCSSTRRRSADGGCSGLLPC